MSVSVKDKEFRGALESLETCLMTPRVPGELERWVDQVQAAIDSVGTALVRQVGREHRTLFKQIAAQDPELNARVERLKIGDEHSREQYRALRDRVNCLKVEVPQVSPDEAQLDPELMDFCALGLGLVMHLRKQEVALDTWYQESFQRDRGPGD